MIHVRTSVDRPDPVLVKELGRFSAATIHEAQGRIGALDSRLKPVDPDMEFCGPAYTVVCAPRDNIMLQVAIAYAAAGDVVVASAGEYTEAGSFGDVLANACLAKGLGGLLTDSGVRDTRELKALGFPVFSRSICIKGTVKETVGPMNVPVIVGGAEIRPGDVVRGDADGVVVVRRESLADVVQAAKEREDAEARYIAEYHAGRTVLEVSRLREVLAAKGLVIGP
ncbi:4-carboxy-4-hydroxy-2-oxoadipate aldolase/oxaloacetate decarboxylase [Pseudonocardia sp. DSM 110487]|uniref:4-carboxy-4-hydroxy-2-oxoadipate aldolase/oxaloacetate decarboxylase n=1 Tax=Pseudonocardia sp. DSM 110487 TaxID=2865833 RepID=UPI001C6A5150|nr:4-carboxy-4-hydroxy-2-oxoadipate aldolase/oxaloacetate decarboxylase [Pseudonocardia sp. DSM 110487]QYN33673.1 4-carboxy-4-hydroxy-2-oxoadipate aldolase/oxaloacetate decarboxylase [Pseudonocardia sp. DSM 110487]